MIMKRFSIWKKYELTIKWTNLFVWLFLGTFSGTKPCGIIFLCMNSLLVNQNSKFMVFFVMPFQNGKFQKSIGDLLLSEWKYLYDPEYLITSSCYLLDIIHCSSHAWYWLTRNNVFLISALFIRISNIKSNRPFAGPGHTVQNYIYWWASCTVGLPKQCTCLCFGSLTAQLVHQYM